MLNFVLFCRLSWERFDQLFLGSSTTELLSNFNEAMLFCIPSTSTIFSGFSVISYAMLKSVDNDWLHVKRSSKRATAQVVGSCSSAESC